MFVVLLLIVVVTMKRMNESYKYFPRRNIRTPPFEYFFGHLRILWSTKHFSKQIEEWTRHYGKIFGLYEGRRPVYVVSDVEFLHEVFVKQFSLFHSRRVPFLARMGRGTHENLFGSEGPTWRKQRRIVNPTFSSNKIRSILPFVHRSIEILIDKFNQHIDRHQHENDEFNIDPFYKRMTMDIIWRSAFGIESEMQDDIENIYLKKSSSVIEMNFDHLWIVKLSVLLPCLTPLLIRLVRIQLKFIRFMSTRIDCFRYFIDELPPFWIIRQAQQIIDYRQQRNHRNENENDNKEQFTDLLQLMIDGNVQQDENDEKRLDRDEICANILIFIIAGYETTSTTLSYATFILATKADVQKKLFDEIDVDIDENDHRSNSSTSYIDLFIREVLRMFPIIVQATSRECHQTTIIDGHRIDKGSIIQPDIQTIHYDKDLWGPEDPNEFVPERHLKKRHPMCWMAFGHGPRNCLGMRLALIEIKICLKKILKHFEILPSEHFNEHFRSNLIETSVIHPPSLFVRLKRRI